jgi:integrase
MTALEQAMTDYLQLRRSLGHELADAGRLLPSFVSYLAAQGASTVTIEAALAWSQQTASGTVTSVGARRMTAVRGFARYLAGIDEQTQVPPLGLVPHQQRRRRAFIYLTADIDAVLSQIGCSMLSPLRVATYQTLIGLLTVSGMRIGEAIKLDRSDVNWDDGVLLIRESKFGKSRLVPLHPSTVKALAAHAELRDTLLPHPKEPSFFVSLTRRRLSYAVVCQTFRQLVDNAGVGTEAPSPPRLHDIRHTFAVRTLLEWYRSGQDVQAKLPSLSTYLGHREPASTYWYLSATPELLALAAARQNRAWAAARSAGQS